MLSMPPFEAISHILRSSFSSTLFFASYMNDSHFPTPRLPTAMRNQRRRQHLRRMPDSDRG